MVVTSMLLHGWIVLVVAVALAGGIAGALAWAGALERAKDAVRTANAAFVPQLRSVRAAMRRRSVALTAGLAALCVSALAFGVVAARPVDKEVSQPRLATRDIVLCLDASGSMLGYDTKIIDRFLTLLDSFHGERIALSIWNQTSSTVFPLTDDYELARRELQEARAAMDIDVDAAMAGYEDPAKVDAYLDFTAGTVLDENSEQSSLIGDGLVSCSLLFSGSEEQRSRSIILASDNEVFGPATIELGPAAEYAAGQGIALVGIFGGNPYSGDPDGMRADLGAVGGAFYEANDPQAVPGILDQIASQQIMELNAVPEVHINDRPTTAATVAALSLLLALGLMWWVRE